MNLTATHGLALVGAGLVSVAVSRWNKLAALVVFALFEGAGYLLISESISESRFPLSGISLVQTTLWLGGGVGAAVLVNVFVNNFVVLKTDGPSGLVSFLRRSLDMRTLYLAGALLVAIFLTLIFEANAKLKSADQGFSIFWQDFYPAWLASLYFFSVVGVLATIITYARPEQEPFSRRVQILASGKNGPAVRFLERRLQEIDDLRHYLSSYEATIEFVDVRPEVNAIKFKLTVKVTSIPIFDDVPSAYMGLIRCQPDKLDPPIEPFGSVIGVEIDGVSRLNADPIPMYSRDANASGVWEHRVIGARETYRRQNISTEWSAWYSMAEEQTWSSSVFVSDGTIHIKNSIDSPAFGRFSVAHISADTATDTLTTGKMENTGTERSVPALHWEQLGTGRQMDVRLPSAGVEPLVNMVRFRVKCDSVAKSPEEKVA